MADAPRTDDIRGKAKEAAGKAADDENLENEGKRDQAKASVKDAANKVKDAVTGSDSD